ncbi:AAA family ATPase [Nannocystis sp.]|uniref:AAA family ATPase n=1 Tax=Nannocystis sp. TaxID=1962667 RepID=UPI0025EA583E|nr:AAA family ATPase [Nannocystis sp.]MBK7827650.1 AAA family ATPase [Nannocystis sp.]
MSYIRRITIAKFRGIERLDVDLSPRDGTKFRHLILTGPNGSGKSSALELIHAALPKLTMPAQPSAPCHVGLDEQPHDGGRGQIVAFFQAQRLLRIEEVSGPSKIDWMNILRGRITATQQTVQYLVNRKVEQSLARDDGDQAAVAAIEAWFAELQGHLAHLFEDPALALHFDRKNFTVSLRYSDGREVSFAQLAQGHSAALSIFFELLLQSQAHREEFKREQLAGIVLIDEIETHLHIRLQELILPFLTDIFPTFQFIVATHSPAVIASIPDAVVYDLGKREATDSADLQGVRYGTLMTHHFGITADMDLDSTAKLQRLRELAGRARSAAEEQEMTTLSDTLSERSRTLALEVWKIQNPSPVRALAGAS